MQELSVILKARQFIEDVGVDSIPVDIEQYAKAANAKIRISHDFDDDESGQTFPSSSKHIIAINGNHSEERQRFTILHEIAHIILNLPSIHHSSNLSTSELISYRKRPQEEIFCDVFAAECLLPFALFKKDVSDVDVSFNSVKELAKKYKASITCTGSRFAVNCDVPCAFVLIEDGKIRYVSRSTSLRELNGWIQFGTLVPKGSVAQRILNSDTTAEDNDEISSDVWFVNGVKNHRLMIEESIVIRELRQCLSLIWFHEELPVMKEYDFEFSDYENPLLEELDGILPWPSKKRRK